MKYFKLKYPDGNIKYCKGINSLEIIKKYDLCTRENAEVVIVELNGEQKAIAIDYLS
jgi:hypothetical protein